MHYSNQLIRAFLFLSLCLCLTVAGTADTLRVVSYNALNLRGSTMGDRTADFRTVMESIQPDIAVFQEIIDQDAVDNLLSFVFLPINDDWSSVIFQDGPDTDNAFLYRTSKVEFLGQRAIPTTLRDINEYRFRPLALSDDEEVRFYSGHLKASSGSDNEERRRQEAAALRQQLNMLASDALFAFMGDFNLYDSDEPAYQLLLDPEPDTDGQLFDPIDTPGEWHNSISYAAIHTQSPRTTSFGGGSTGGMDDRFDFILVSSAFMNQEGSYVLTDSYKAWGNDGQHYNQAINSGTNGVVSAEVADALHYASDHLPVVADFVFEPVSDANIQPVIADNIVLLQCYPNPFNSSLTIDISGLKQSGRLSVFDIQGRTIFSENLNRGSALSLTRSYDFSSFVTGIYFVNLSHGAQNTTQKVIYLR